MLQHILLIIVFFSFMSRLFLFYAWQNAATCGNMYSVCGKTCALKANVAKCSEFVALLGNTNHINNNINFTTNDNNNNNNTNNNTTITKIIIYIYIYTYIYIYIYIYIL